MLERREKWVEAVRGVVEGALLCGACKGQYGYLVWTTEIHTSHALTKSPHAALPKGDEAKADCGIDDGESSSPTPSVQRSDSERGGGLAGTTLRS